MTDQCLASLTNGYPRRKTLPKFVLQSTMSYGMENPLHQFRSDLQDVPSPGFLPTPNLLVVEVGRVEWENEKALMPSSSIQQ